MCSLCIVCTVCVYLCTTILASYSTLVLLQQYEYVLASNVAWDRPVCVPYPGRTRLLEYVATTRSQRHARMIRDFKIDFVWRCTNTLASSQSYAQYNIIYIYVCVCTSVWYAYIHTSSYHTHIHHACRRQILYAQYVARWYRTSVPGSRYSGSNV